MLPLAALDPRLIRLGLILALLLALGVAGRWAFVSIKAMGRAECEAAHRAAAEAKQDEVDEHARTVAAFAARFAAERGERERRAQRIEDEIRADTGGACRSIDSGSLRRLYRRWGG